jgi:hypothetical protein
MPPPTLLDKSKNGSKKAPAAVESREGSGRTRRTPTEPDISSREGSGRPRTGDEVAGSIATQFTVTTITSMTTEQLEELRKLENDLDAQFDKIAQFLAVTNVFLLMINIQWKKDLFSNSHVAFHFQNYIYALDAGFNDQQIGIFCGIFKDLLEQALEKNLSHDVSAKSFKNLLLSYSDMSPNGVFSSAEIEQITEFAIATFFSHYGLLLFVYSFEQEKELMELHLDLVDIPKFPSLDEAMPLEEYEAQEAKLKNERERVEFEEELIREQERLAMINPFEELDTAAARKIISETVKEVLQNVDRDFDKILSEQKERFVSMIGSRYKD